MPTYLKINEVAEMLRLGERAVYEMLRTGRIPGAAKAGGKWRVGKDKLVEWMAAGGELAGDQGDNKDDQGRGRL